MAPLQTMPTFSELSCIEKETVIRELGYSDNRGSSPIIAIIIHGLQHPMSVHYGMRHNVPEHCTAWHIPSYIKCMTSLGIAIPKGELQEDKREELRAVVQCWMNKYKITADKIVRHYDLNIKCLCPEAYVEPKKWVDLLAYITR